MRHSTSSAQGKLQGWRLRDTLAAAFLLGATAAWVSWQNTRVAVLWDLGYLLDTSWRIACGQMPYRDFPLVHPPLTFLIQAGFIKAFGRHYALAIAYAAVAGGLGSVVTWRIVRRLLVCGEYGRSWWLSLCLALPLVPLGLYSIYPHPIYDCDCVLAVLLALWLLLRMSQGWTAVLAGAACVVPLFTKQNIGLPFLIAVIAGMLLLLALAFRQGTAPARLLRSAPAGVLAGVVSSLALCTATIAATAGVGNYLHWTIGFAAQRRLPGLGRLLSVYRASSLFWMLPCLLAGLWLLSRRGARKTLWIGGTFLAAPFLGTLLISLLHHDAAPDRADDLLTLWPAWLLVAAGCAFLHLRHGADMPSLLPWFALAAIHGTFLSQQLWGSTYALWPLLLVLLAGVLRCTPDIAQRIAIPAAAVSLGVCGTLYAASLERLSYVNLPQAPPQHAATPALRGLATPGPYLAHLDELVGFVSREIPAEDELISIPGEDPLFYATGRAPQFPVTLFDSTTDPYSADELFAEARQRRIRWIVLKRALQMDSSPLPDAENTSLLLSRDFALVKQLGGYDIFKRIENPAEP